MFSERERERERNTEKLRGCRRKTQPAGGREKMESGKGRRLNEGSVKYDPEFESPDSRLFPEFRKVGLFSLRSSGISSFYYPL